MPKYYKKKIKADPYAWLFKRWYEDPNNVKYFLSLTQDEQLEFLKHVENH
jgi:hypothetical protein